MPRPKGTPKTGGRKKGTPNKNIRFDREQLREHFEANLPEFWERLRRLDDKDYCANMLKLMPFLVSQLKSVDVTENSTEQSQTMSAILKSLSDKL